MKLENSFTVTAPIDQTWQTLLDIERVASCLPGAKIEPSEDDGVYRGAMKVKLGPMTVDYRGTARFQDVDEDTHTASIAVQAREAKGQGTAAAVIRNQLEPADGGTKVVAITDLKITGRQAQFGRGIMEDVASTMMGEFAKRLEGEIQSGSATEKPTTAPADESRAAAPPPPQAERADAADETEALDLGNVLARTQIARYGAIAAGALLVLLAVAALLRGRRRQLTVNLNLRR
ncbi:MAG: carbon monoxide dehydrogenase [Solirubrobacterales bacterium]|nr:carbon monoxide dehydrogenase [Solirubrobacterales bacterium]